MPQATTAGGKRVPAPGIVRPDAARAVLRVVTQHGALIVALIGAVFLLPYAAGYGDRRMTLWRWLQIHWAEPTWQHGALAPLIAAFLVWRRRAALARLEIRPRTTGLVLAAAGMFLFWVGYLGNFYYVGYASLHLLAAAAVLWIFGWEHLKGVSFAWFVLGFAWPYLFLEDTLAFRLRYLMVQVTEWVLNHAGVATLRNGTELASAATQTRAQGELFCLSVDGPCSGMRSLFALMMVSALFGYFRQRSFWRRALLFTLSVPLAVLSNMVRLIVLITGSILFGQNFAVGHGESYTSNFHLIAGIAVFLVSLTGLRLAEGCLNRFCGRERPLPLIEPA